VGCSAALGTGRRGGGGMPARWGRGWAMRGRESFHGSLGRCGLAWTVMDRRGALFIEELPWWPAAALGSGGQCVEGGGVASWP
jgi:hypothetical protein